MLTKDLSRDDLGLGGFGNIGRAWRENGIAIVCASIAGQKSNEPLEVYLVGQSGLTPRLVVDTSKRKIRVNGSDSRLTENAGIFMYGQSSVLTCSSRFGRISTLITPPLSRADDGLLSPHCERTFFLRTTFTLVPQGSSDLRSSWAPARQSP